MKKIISVFLSLIILLSSVPAAGTAYANTMEKADTVGLGESVTATVSKTDDKAVNYWVKFTCTQSGYYEFVNEKSTDPMGFVYTYIYSSDKTQLDFLISDMSESSVKMCRYLEAGSDYYFCIKVDDGDYTSSVTVNSHSHSYVLRSVPAVCDDDPEIRASGGLYSYCPECKDYQLIRPYPCAAGTALSKTVYTYNGKEKTPKITVTDEYGNVISPSNYTVSYEDNINPGRAAAYISFNSAEYFGETVCFYTINPKKVSSLKLSSAAKNKFKASWAKDSSVTGYEVQYGTSEKFSKSKTKTVTVSKKSKSYAVLSGLKSKKRYYVRVRAYKLSGGRKYYGAWSAVKNIKTK